MVTGKSVPVVPKMNSSLKVKAQITPLIFTVSTDCIPNLTVNIPFALVWKYNCLLFAQILAEVRDSNSASHLLHLDIFEIGQLCDLNHIDNDFRFVVKQIYCISKFFKLCVLKNFT